jgi:hypothetical protein
MESPAAPSVVADPTTEELRAHYVFRDEPAVQRNLQRRRHLVAVLDETRRVLPHYFGDAELVLDLFVDPDDPSDETLFALVRTPLDSDAALSRLRQFDRDWWLAELERVGDDLSISIEHV